MADRPTKVSATKTERKPAGTHELCTALVSLGGAAPGNRPTSWKRQSWGLDASRPTLNL